MKPGYKTTEFWMNLVVTILGALLMGGVLGQGQVAQIAGSIITALSNAGYGISRGIAKKR